MKFNKGDTVILTQEAEKEWENGGYFDGHGYVFRGTHKARNYNGDTLFTEEGLGFKNADNVLTLTKNRRKG